MFGSPHNPVKAYKSVSIETAVKTASPYQLITLLFDGAKQAVIVGRAALLAKDVAKKGESVTQAIDIILNGLRVSLNVEAGGELAERLSALYSYMARRLLHATAKNDEAAFTEVLDLLTVLQEAWTGIGDEVKKLPTAAKPPQ